MTRRLRIRPVGRLLQKDEGHTHGLIVVKPHVLQEPDVDRMGTRMARRGHRVAHAEAKKNHDCGERNHPRHRHGGEACH